MLRLFLLLSFLSLSLSVKSQHKVEVVLHQKPKLHQQDLIYITGAFNKWAPGDTSSLLSKPLNGKQTFVINNVKPGLLEFKFTRGDWKTLESTKDGRLVAPRKAIITKDTLINVEIEGWRDDFQASTASKQVHLLSDQFDIPQLGLKRKVWIYLPEDYDKSKGKYPVLYMHDGQDLFDEATSQGRIGPLEWGVDETIDKAKLKCIVVAVEHDEDKLKRTREYFYHDNPDNSNVEGKKYLDFIVNNLKPYIDKNYRTKADKANTFMSGSSMGGLITFYAGLNYPETFGVLGVLSPSIWLDHGNINKEISQKLNQPAIKQQRYFFYGGGNENRTKPDGSFVKMNDDINKAVAEFKPSAATIKVSINPEGRHGAWYWKSAFAEFYQWLTMH
ncbi:MAG: alpha/beta hydrolase [Pedobacter sp.]|nr:MAG: alpha/beta hydrolase [Pedobacter sp.]